MDTSNITPKGEEVKGGSAIASPAPEASALDPMRGHRDNVATIVAREGKPRGRYAVIGLDVPGAEVAIRLELGDWKQRSGSALEAAPREIKQGDHYRILWVMAKGVGQIRMYAETKDSLLLYTGYEGCDRWDAVDAQVEKAIGRSIANIPAVVAGVA